MEKIFNVLNYLQMESTMINRSIRISKNALCCFVMSTYRGNRAHLRSELRQSCALAFENSSRTHSLTVDIDLDQISTSVLNHIVNVNDSYDELTSTINLFNLEYFYFSAQKENKEIETLASLYREDQEYNELSNNTNNTDFILSRCIQDIENSSQIQLNSIRSILVQDAYDSLYPVLASSQIAQNENLLYGLILHLSNLINRNQQLPDSEQNHLKTLARPSDYKIAEQLAKIIKQTFHIQLNESEIKYIACYLYLSSQWITKTYIQLLMVSESDEAIHSLSKFINTQTNKVIAHHLKINAYMGHSIQNSILNKMSDIDRGKGVIVLINQEELDKYNIDLSTYKGQYKILNELSANRLLLLAKRIESLSISLDNLPETSEAEQERQPIESDLQIHAQSLLLDIQSKLLAESLVFLNPEKACQTLYPVLMNILQDLDIHYSDDLLIKFIFHTSFCIERCIKQDFFQYKHANALIVSHPRLAGVIEKNMKRLCEIFSIQIPISELCYLIEIFVPYVEAS